MEKETASAGITAFQWVALIVPVLASIAILWMQVRANNKMERMKSEMEIIRNTRLSIRNDERAAILRFNETVHTAYSEMVSGYRYFTKSNEPYLNPDIISRERMEKVESLHNSTQLALANLDFFVDDQELMESSKRLVDYLYSGALVPMINLYHAVHFGHLEAEHIKHLEPNIQQIRIDETLQGLTNAYHEMEKEFPPLVKKYNALALGYMYRD